MGTGACNGTCNSGGPLPSIDVADAPLDERRQLTRQAATMSERYTAILGAHNLKTCTDLSCPVKIRGVTGFGDPVRGDQARYAGQRATALPLTTDRAVMMGSFPLKSRSEAWERGKPSPHHGRRIASEDRIVKYYGTRPDSCQYCDRVVESCYMRWDLGHARCMECVGEGRIPKLWGDYMPPPRLRCRDLTRCVVAQEFSCVGSVVGVRLGTIFQNVLRSRCDPKGRWGDRCLGISTHALRLHSQKDRLSLGYEPRTNWVCPRSSIHRAR
jgi:hypothetical protein